MIFENDTLRQSALYDKNNVMENESLFPSIINTYGVTAFLIKSMEKIRDNATCETLKNAIDTYTKEYILNIREYHYQASRSRIGATQENETEGVYFEQYAKTAYYKVLQEKEYLNKFLHSFKNEEDYI